MTQQIPLTWFLYFASASFAIGLMGVLMRRNAIGVLMAIEIMLNAANVNFVAFWRYGTAPAGEGPLTGVMMALFVVTIAAAEVAVGLALLVMIFMRKKTTNIDTMTTLKG